MLKLIELGEQKREHMNRVSRGKEVEVLVEENRTEWKRKRQDIQKEYMKIALETNENLKNSIVKVQIGKDLQIIH